MLSDAAPLYTRFKAYQNKKVFTYNKTLGPTGGVLFFEKATFEPHIVLQDIAYWLHPEKFEEYRPYYFKSLDP
jgi:iron complex transport system substrate-binding protein